MKSLNDKDFRNKKLVGQSLGQLISLLNSVSDTVYNVNISEL